MNGALDDGSAFAIATSLLEDSNSGWSNLGLWSAATEYSQACAALARETGRAVQLSAEDDLLELACGEGASLHLWREEFGVRRIAALERQRVCVDAILAGLKPEISVQHGRFDVLPLPLPLAAKKFSVVLCVDAAMHADSLAAFVQVAGSALATNGRLSFTTLTHGPDWVAGSTNVRRLQWALAQANIPAGSVLAEPALRTTLSAAGFADISVRHFDANVFAGFANYIERRSRLLPWHRKMSAGWLKIRATAMLCRYVHTNHLLHYSLVTARLR